MRVLTKTKTVSKNVNYVESVYQLALLAAYVIHVIVCGNIAIAVKNILKKCLLLEVNEFAENV